jgi:hypothetical protein
MITYYTRNHTLVQLYNMLVPLQVLIKHITNEPTGQPDSSCNGSDFYFGDVLFEWQSGRLSTLISLPVY